VLVTVDDLPIAAGRLHPDDAGRERLTNDLLAVLRKHGIKAVTPLGDATPGGVHGASVVARWSLRRDGAAPASGHTLLVLRRSGNAWRIVHDASL
jgi:hypothetical protein